MRSFYFIYLLSILTLLSSCDDGDVITETLEFENTFQVCGDTDLVFYKTKNNPSESLSIVLNDITLDEILEVEENGEFSKQIPLGSKGRFNYRTYSNNSLPNNLFCNLVPVSGANITSDIQISDSNSVVLINTTLVEDDNDGIPAELDIDTDNNNDTDGDGILNFIDADDDGDNVLTKDENPDPNGDGDLSDAQDTDNDGIPDYLDVDDDGDGINTRDEDPTSDPINSNIVPDYLNENVANTDTEKATAFIKHRIFRTYRVTISITNIEIDAYTTDLFNFGVLESSATSTSIEVVPDFI